MRDTQKVDPSCFKSSYKCNSNSPSLQSIPDAYSIPGSHLGRGLGDVGLVLVIDHPRGPVLGNEGADVGPGVFDARLRVAQKIILYREDN